MVNLMKIIPKCAKHAETPKIIIVGGQKRRKKGLKPLLRYEKL